MNVWNKVLIGLIIPCLLGCVYLSSVVLGAHHNYRGRNPAVQGKSIAKLEREIESLKLQAELVQNGKSDAEYEASPDDPRAAGIRRLEAKLGSLVVDRKRVWYRCEYQGGAKVLVPPPLPADQPGGGIHGLTLNMVVYVFEDDTPTQRGGYIGEYIVTGVPADGVELTRRIEVDPSRFAQGRGSTWTICEQMPIDRHDVFDKSTLADVLAGLPEAELAKFQNDNVVPPEGGDAFVRPLTDFAIAFEVLTAQMSHLDDQKTAAQADIVSLEAARADATDRNDAGQLAIQNSLRPELARATRERDLVARQLAALEAAIEEARTEIDQLVEANRRAAAEYAAQQESLRDRIDAAVDAELAKLESSGGDETAK